MNLDPKSDYHIHTVFSDGAAPIDEMVSAAIEKGLKAITITDHMPLPYGNRYAMQPEKLEEYRHQIRFAKRKYADRISVRMGLEFEYSQKLEPWINSIADIGWEHSIASVHSLFIDHRPYMTNGSEDEFRILFECCDYNIEKICRSYYETLQEAAQTGLFDIVGHLDVIKKHNTNACYFNESALWYQTLVLETLDTIKRSGMKMEINMGGFNHPIGEQYPSKWIIREAAKRNIQLVLSSDSHKPESMGQYFSKIYDFGFSNSPTDSEINSNINVLKAS